MTDDLETALTTLENIANELYQGVLGLPVNVTGSKRALALEQIEEAKELVREVGRALVKVEKIVGEGDE